MEPRGGTRLRLAAPDVAFDLIAPSRCEGLEEPAVAALRASLGPDPLREDADEKEAVLRMTAARAPVGAAILDQSVWAGVGNAWRAELLFLAGLHPADRGLGADAASRLWEAAVVYMALGPNPPPPPDRPDENSRPSPRPCPAPACSRCRGASLGQAGRPMVNLVPPEVGWPRYCSSLTERRR